MSKNLKPIDAYLPDKEKERLLQVRIPEFLFDAANEWRQFDDVTWKELTIALFKRYIDERAKE